MLAIFKGKLAILSVLWISGVVYMPAPCLAQEGDALKSDVQKSQICIGDLAQAQIDAVANAIEALSIELGRCPQGTSVDIAKQLSDRGFYRPGPARLSKEGAILDQWSTPIVIITDNEKGIVVLSAGPDRRFDSEKVIFAYRPMRNSDLSVRADNKE